MKLRHVVAMLIAVVAAYLIIGNPPMLKNARGQESMEPDQRKLHEFLLIDALAAALVIALFTGEPISGRRGRSEPMFKLSPEASDEDDYDEEYEDEREYNDHDLHITPATPVHPSAYWVFDPANPSGQSSLPPIRKMIVFGAVLALIVMVGFLFVQGLSPAR